ncbi:MAG: hypothetical protein ACXWRZ_08145 [Bdellovibrio sp.]
MAKVEKLILTLLSVEEPHIGIRGSKPKIILKKWYNHKCVATSRIPATL